MENKLYIIGIKCSLTTSDNEDPEIIEILENDVDFGRTLHSYGKEVSVNPIRFKINENCVDGRHIRLTINSICENGTGETIAQDIVITAENGEFLLNVAHKYEDASILSSIENELIKEGIVPLNEERNIDQNNVGIILPN